MTETADDDLDPAFFAEMVDTVGVGVGIYGSDGRYLYVNTAYADYFDVTPAALTGTPIWEIATELDAEEFRCYWDSFDAGETRTAETTHEYDGVAVPVETVTTCRLIDGTPYHFGTIKDVTERREREQELKQQNERLDAFANVVSHDLRNPLNVAQGYLDIVRDDDDRTELALVENALERMESLVEQLLTFARLGEGAVDSAPVSVATTARAAWETVATDQATLDVDEGEHRIRADEARLRQLFENLFRNAVEHGSTSPGSQTRQDAVEHGGADVTVRVGPLADGFYVADDGPGIPENEREEIFATGYSTQDDGTGFGLAIVTHIVDAHDWEITATESDDGGALFEITGAPVLE